MFKFPNFTSGLKNNNRETCYRGIFIFTVFAAFILFPILSFDFGITWDDRMQGHYGKLLLRFYFTGGANHDFMTFTRDSFLYGGFFDMITGLIYGIFFDSLPHFIQSNLNDTILGMSRQDIWGSGFYETRHVINSLFGCIAILYTGLLTRRLTSWKGACIALCLLLLSPRFVGHSMNNPKDIPFAAVYIFSVYYVCRFVSELPKPRRSTLLLLSLGLGTAMAIRVGGLLLFFYLAIAAISKVLTAVSFEDKKSLARPTFIRTIICLAGGYAAGILLWPYGLMNPITHPLKALTTFSHFSGAGAGNSLFNGQLVPNDALPWSYIPQWMLITIPLSVILGFLFSLVPTQNRQKGIWIVWLVFLFPLLSVMIKKPVLYDGWRHLLFIYPPLVVLASTGWLKIADLFKSARVRFLPILLLAGLQAQPLFWMIKNHPNEYVYFNPVIGGLNQAQGKYPIEYWGNCLREAAEWLGDYHHKNYSGKPAIVHAEGELMSSYPYLKKALGESYIPYPLVPEEIRKKTPPRYALLLNKNIPPEDFKKSAWPPKDSIYNVRADGIVICSVAENPSVS